MKFEFKKILSNKIIVVFFAVIFAAALAYFFRAMGTFEAWGKYDPAEIQSELDYIEEYEQRSEQVIKSAERIKAETSNIYKQRLSDKIIAQRQNRRELTTGDNKAVMWFRLALDDTYISLLPILFCILISAELFCGEIRSGVFKFNFTSKNGRLCLYRKKIFTLMIFSACTAVLYTAIQLVAVLPKYGLTDLNIPLQIYDSYINCAYNIGFLQFVFATVGMRILCCWFICFLTVCLALLFRSLIASAAASGAVFALLFVLYERTLQTHGGTTVKSTQYALHHGLLKFSPICLFDPNGFFVSSDYVNVLDYPVTELFVNLAVSVIITAVLAALGGYLFARKRRRLS
ncbi:MAG: ABC transporter permease subunit [Oscillospiraceae bacterium]|nr:ABC transporter permease subunit [Oscillospiraceae bacterium]